MHFRIFTFYIAVVLIFSHSLQAEQTKPNILFLLSDDHSYPYLSCYGDSNVKTPVLDQLASEGIKFHRFFTTAPQCVPSRASLMSGRSPVAARITRFSSPLPRDVITLPEVLRAQGNYYTGICGRTYHLDGSNKVSETIMQTYEDHRLRTFEDRVDSLKTGSDPEAVKQFAEFMNARPKDKPFFMWANFSDPHHPWNAPDKYRPDPKSLKLPPQWPDVPGMREQMADYCAEINRVDETIGHLLEILKTHQVYDNTIIVFAGDNGQALPHGKGSLYDPGCNVPFLVKWKGVIKPGSESRALISGEDLAPTLIDAAGLIKDKGMTGLSFLKLLQGAADYQPRKYLHLERGPHGTAPVTENGSNASYDLSRAIRSDHFKLIYNCTPWLAYAPVDSAGGAAWTDIKAAHQKNILSAGLEKTYFTLPRPIYELYDLESDPGELNNLSGNPSYADIERELRNQLAVKMVTDFDYLPLPDLMQEGTNKKPANRKVK